MFTTILVIGCAAGCFGLGVWGVASHFRVVGKVPIAMRATTAMGALGFSWFLFDRWRSWRDGTPPAALQDVAAAAVFAASATLFWWAVASGRARPLTIAFSTDKPDFVRRTGPYRYVRHPFYSSYVAFWVATAIGSRSVWHWLPVAVMAILYYSVARMEEAKFARSDVAAEYETYRSRTGMLVPQPWRRSREGA